MSLFPRLLVSSELMALFAVLGHTPAHAQKGALTIGSPKPGDIRTVVTGRGEAASVAWPEGRASMTPRWLVANASIDWNCQGSKAVDLEVKTGKGPGSKPRTFELLRKHGLYGSSTQMELYLWEVSSVKAACAKDGQALVDSVPVNLTLRCESGRVFKEKLILPLQVSCQPSTPSQEAVTGITGSETERRQTPNSFSMLLKFARHSPDPSPSDLSLSKTSTLEFTRLLRRVWAPEIQSLRVVRLDANGQVAERFPPVPLSGSEDDPEFKPQLTLTPQAAGPVRFALEAEYADGSRLLSQPSEVQVLSPEQEAAKKAKEISFDRRMQLFKEVGEQIKVLGCSPKVVEWLKQQPIIEDADVLMESNVWFRFTDGQSGTAHCHRERPPRAP